MTIQSILAAVEQTGVLTLEQARQINALITRHSLSLQEQQALDHLTLAMQQRQIQVAKP